jgi:CRP/FNR family transcriptional regulator, cyclic AMP receptor protein
MSAMESNQVNLFVRSLPVFAALTDTEVDQLAAAGQKQHIERFNFVFMPDQSADYVYLLLQGRVKIGTFSPDGREVIKDIIRPGTIFGDLALIGEKKHTEFAQALQDEAQVLQLKVSDFHHFMQRNQNLMIAFMSHLTQRLHRLEERLTKLMVKDARERIIEFLLETAQREGRRVGYETLIKHQLTQQEIANITGTSRQTVTSVFNDLRKSNLIHFNRNTVLIRDMQKLA